MRNVLTHPNYPCTKALAKGVLLVNKTYALMTQNLSFRPPKGMLLIIEL